MTTVIEFLFGGANLCGTKFVDGIKSAPNYPGFMTRRIMRSTCRS